MQAHSFPEHFRRNWKVGSGGNICGVLLTSAGNRGRDPAMHRGRFPAACGVHVEPGESIRRILGTDARAVRAIHQVGSRDGRTSSRARPDGGRPSWPLPVAKRSCRCGDGRRPRMVDKVCSLDTRRFISTQACRAPATDLLSESIVAQRAAILCAAAEEAFGESLAQAQEPVYVIGTEVPAPGRRTGGRTRILG